MPTANHCERNLNAAHNPAARVFYDGSCPFCRREIAHYQWLRGADRLAWIDISRPETDLSVFGLNREAAMARMHVQDAAGHWHTGAWAFAEMWSHLPKYRWLAGMLLKTGTLPLVDRAYTAFARWRLQRRCVQPADGTTNILCATRNNEQRWSVKS